MAKNIELEQLVINKLTQEQFDSIEVKNPAELYFITDAEADGGKGAQVEEMPEATEINAGQIVQYVGETIPDVEATAVITQTVGDSLTDLKVNAEKFEKASGLTEAGSVEFVAEITEDNAILGEQVGTFSYSFDSDIFISKLISIWGENWWESTGGTDMFFVYANNMWGLSNSVPVLEETMGIQIRAWLSGAGDWGFYVSDDSQVANNDYIPVSVVLGSTKWLQDTNEILPSDYGITYSGTPSNGDTLKVDYTPFVGGYEKGYFYVNQAQLSDSVVTHKWNQINVQPASKSSGGIEWVTKLDLPADYPESYRGSCHPIWTIPGGVPDGTYEFYTQSLCGTEWEPERIGVQNYTVKVLVKFYTKNDVQYHVGAVSYVVDGTWTGDANFRPTELTIYQSFKKGDNNLYFWYEGNPFQSFLPAYAGAVAIPGIFKMSAWKNIDSGETYIPEGMLYTGSHPRYEIYIEGQLDLQPLCAPVNYPSFYKKYNVNIKTNSQYALIGPEYVFNDGTRSMASAQSATFDIKSESGGTFYATTTNKNGSCVVQELESSGDLKNVQLGVGDDGKSYIYFNNNDLSHVEISFSLTGMRNTESNASLTFASWVNPSSFTPLNIERVGAPITALNLGKTLQYTQESTDEYTKGYFYKSSGTLTKIPASMEITRQSVDGVEILIDAEKLAQAISSYGGWSISHVKNELLRYNYTYIYYENEGSPYVYIGFLGDCWDSSVVECFTINGELPDKYIEFNAGNYIGSTVEVVDGKWEQINVQPESEGGLTKEEADQTYLPLSGGTLKGTLYAQDIVPYQGNPSYTLGSPFTKWYRTYTNNLNNGADIAIPTTGGTLARIEDIPEDTQRETLPTASADNLNKIYQYVGETSETYTNGSFYKCTENITITLSMMNSFVSSGASATLDSEKFASQNPIFADTDTSNTPYPAWRADYQDSGTWNVWTQTPNLSITTDELASVWGITISGTPEVGDMIAVMKQEEATYAWAEVVLGEKLPDQTNNAGKFLKTDGTTASWGNALENIAPEGSDSIVVGSGASVGNAHDAVIIGTNAGRTVSGYGAVAIGNNAGHSSLATSAIAIGIDSQAGYLTNGAIAIGAYARASASNAIQLGMKSSFAGYSNSDANTFKVGNANGNFEIMSADGTIPAERMLKTVELVDSSVELAINTIYNAGEMASLSITFPTVDVRYTSQLNFTSGTTATAFTAPDDIKWDGDSIVEGAFVPETNKRYVILFYYDGVNICAIARG